VDSTFWKCGKFKKCSFERDIAVFCGKCSFDNLMHMQNLIKKKKMHMQKWESQITCILYIECGSPHYIYIFLWYHTIY
jgi:hypothetical protein